MEYIKKSDITEALQRFIDARKDRNCSRQALIEKTAFEYALAIVNRAEVHEFED